VGIAHEVVELSSALALATVWRGDADRLIQHCGGRPYPASRARSGGSKDFPIVRKLRLPLPIGLQHRNHSDGSFTERAGDAPSYQKLAQVSRRKRSGRVEPADGRRGILVGPKDIAGECYAADVTVRYDDCSLRKK
jgi:hypothetical protein